jgi:hypothetical protein
MAEDPPLLSMMAPAFYNQGELPRSPAALRAPRGAARLIG